MPSGLKRFQQAEALHFITSSPFHRPPLLEAPWVKETLEAIPEQTRARHEAQMHADVLMPQPLLVNEPPRIPLAPFLKALKQMTSRKLRGQRRQFWQARYYDSNIRGETASPTHRDKAAMNGAQPGRCDAMQTGVEVMPGPPANLTNDSINSYSWDANGNAITVNGVTSTYDALGRMVEQNHSGAYTQIVYAPGGGKLALMSGSALQKAFIGLPGQAVAVYTSSGLNHYRHTDWLGSARLTSSPTQSVLFTTGYAPYGEPYATAGTADPSFTGQNQDTSLTIYDFPAREYSMQGRWPSPDPSGLSAVNPAAPQSWNRYAYVQGNPLTLTDPSGLDCVYTNDDGSVKRVQEGDCDSEDDDGYYVDGTIVGGASGVTFDSVSGSYSFMLTDDQGYTFQSGIDTASPSVTFYGEGSGLGPDDPTTTAVNALAQTTPLLMAFDYNSLNEDREDYYGLKLVGRVGWQVAKLNPNVLLLSCDGVNFVNNHQLSVQVPASTAATTFAAASYAGLEWGEWLVPEVSIPLAAYTDIYVPVAANTFCKSR